MSTQAAEVEEVIKRIRSHRGVQHLMIMNKDGLPLKMSMEMNPSTEQQVKNIHELAIAARRMVRDVDPTDDLLFLRTKSQTEEILISPGTRGDPSVKKSVFDESRIYG